MAKLLTSRGDVVSEDYADAICGLPGKSASAGLAGFASAAFLQQSAMMFLVRKKHA